MGAFGRNILEKTIEHNGKRFKPFSKENAYTKCLMAHNSTISRKLLPSLYYPEEMKTVMLSLECVAKQLNDICRRQVLGKRSINQQKILTTWFNSSRSKMPI